MYLREEKNNLFHPIISPTGHSQAIWLCQDSDSLSHMIESFSCVCVCVSVSACEGEGESSPPGLTQTLYRFSNDIYSAATVAPQRSLRQTKDQNAEFASIICRIKLSIPAKKSCHLKRGAASRMKTAGLTENKLVN